MRRTILSVSLVLFVFLLAGTQLRAQVDVAVVSGASFRPNFPLAPGSYGQVFGDFSGVTTAYADLGQLPLPVMLNNVQVLIDGMAAPLYAVTPEVCAFTVPQATAVGRQVIQVMLGGQIIGEGNVDVIEKSPGIFWAWSSDQTTKIGGVRRAEDYEYTFEATPASRGGYIIIALTGQGNELTAAIADGQAPTSLIETVQTPRVFLSNIEATVEFSGLMPLFPGLWQINAVVPDDLALSGPVPLIVTFGGIASNEVVIWVGN